MWQESKPVPPWEYRRSGRKQTVETPNDPTLNIGSRQVQELGTIQIAKLRRQGKATDKNYGKRACKIWWVIKKGAPMPNIGDHLISSRGLYTSRNIYRKQRSNTLSGFGDGMKTGPVEKVSINKFSLGKGTKSKYKKRKYNRKQEELEADRRDAYSLTGNNCEHF